MRLLHSACQVVGVTKRIIKHRAQRLVVRTQTWHQGDSSKKYSKAFLSPFYLGAREAANF